MGLVKSYQEQGGGNFATATNVAIDEEILIESIYLDDKSFEKAYIMVNGRRVNGEDVKVRLGTQNIARIIEVLGDDEATWPGNKVKCLSTQHYPGLGKTGLLWTGMRASQQSQLPSQQQNQPLPPQTPSALDAMKAWIVENQGLIGQPIPHTVYNVMDKAVIDELVKNKLAYSKHDMPHLDDRAKEFL